MADLLVVEAVVEVVRGLATADFAVVRAVVAGAGAARLPTARPRAAAIGPRTNRLTVVARAAAIPESPAAALQFNQFQALGNRDLGNQAPESQGLKNPDRESPVPENPGRQRLVPESLALKSPAPEDPDPENLGQKSLGLASPVLLSRARENPDPGNPGAAIAPVTAIDPAGPIDREIVLRFNPSHPAIGPITVIDHPVARPATQTGPAHARRIGTDIGRPFTAAGITAIGMAIGIMAALTGTPTRGARGALRQAPSV